MWLGWKLLVTKCSPHILHIFMRFESTIWDIDVNLAGSGITYLETTILVLDITLVHYLGNQITQIRDFWSTLRSTLSAETDRASSLCLGGIMSGWQNVLLSKCLGARLSWSHNVWVSKRGVSKCPGVKMLGAEMSENHNWDRDATFSNGPSVSNMFKTKSYEQNQSIGVRFFWGGPPPPPPSTPKPIGAKIWPNPSLSLEPKCVSLWRSCVMRLFLK